MTEAKIVYFSSDYVFDGRGGPYDEEHPANPICVYGRQKLEAEHLIGLHAKDYLIVRTTVVYGWEYQGKNFISRLVRTLREGKAIAVPIDQVGNPTYAPNLAEAVIELATADEEGVYHIAGPDRVSRYELARGACEIFGLDSTLIKGVLTRALGQVAPRPLDAGLKVDKAAAKLEVRLLGYKEGLRRMAEEEVFDDC